VSQGLRKNLGSLPDWYDKARYGPEGAVTREDVKAAAAMSKRNPYRVMWMQYKKEGLPRQATLPFFHLAKAVYKASFISPA
jgi:hypothetical protein